MRSFAASFRSDIFARFFFVLSPVGAFPCAFSQGGCHRGFCSCALWWGFFRAFSSKGYLCGSPFCAFSRRGFPVRYFAGASSVRSFTGAFSMRSFPGAFSLRSLVGALPVGCFAVAVLCALL